jgi:hypothetical protein
LIRKSESEKNVVRNDLFSFENKWMDDGMKFFGTLFTTLYVLRTKQASDIKVGIMLRTHDGVHRLETFQLHREHDAPRAQVPVSA